MLLILHLPVFQLCHDNLYRAITLDEVQEVGYDDNGSGEEAKEPYLFTYYGGALPDVLSNAIDFWGYFNGATSNTTLVPQIRTTQGIIYPGAIRSASGSTTGVLSSITYPTGGSTSYAYESHLVSNLNADYILNFGEKIGGLRIKTITDNPGSGQPSLIRSFNYVADNGSSSGIIITAPRYSQMNEFETFWPEGNAYLPGQGPDVGIRYSMTIFAYNASPFGVIQGNHVGYSRVEEVIGNTGKNVYHYRVAPASFMVQTKMPIPKPVSMSAVFPLRRQRICWVDR